MFFLFQLIMTRIDFHSNVSNKLGYACRLAYKAYSTQCQVVILTPDETALDALDKTLWTMTELDFIPHARVNDPIAAQSPIVLADQRATAFPHHQILINLTQNSLADFAQFERVIEIVSKEEQDIAAGRERYKFYKQRGYPLNHYIRQ